MGRLTLEDAKDCLYKRPRLQCHKCKFNKLDFDCYAEALEIANMAINYMLVGQKLIESQERIPEVEK